MPRYHFTSNGHEIDIKLADDGLEILHNGQAVTDINDPSYLHEGGFRVLDALDVKQAEKQAERANGWGGPYY